MILAIVGVFASALCYFIAFPTPESRRPLIYAALLAVHLAAVLVYYLLFRGDIGTDAVRYYFDPYNVVGRTDMRVGTIFIFKLEHWLRSAFGGSLFEHFLFFQAFAMGGIAILIRLFNELVIEQDKPLPLVAYIPLFLPGLHFWTVPIGKDGLVFAAIALAIWGMMRPAQRKMWILLSVAVVALVRPHIAVIILFVLVIQALLSSKLSARRRMLFVVPGLAIAAFLLAQAMTIFGVEPRLNSIADFVAQKLAQERGGGDGDIGHLSYPLRLLSFLFRPLVYDAEGLLGLLASFENAILIGMLSYVAIHARKAFALIGTRREMTFAMLFAAITMLALSAVAFNLGASLRQKVMIMPSVLLLFVALLVADRGEPTPRRLKDQDEKSPKSGRIAPPASALPASISNISGATQGFSVFSSRWSSGESLQSVTTSFSFVRLCLAHINRRVLTRCKEIARRSAVSMPGSRQRVRLIETATIATPTGSPRTAWRRNRSR